LAAQEEPKSDEGADASRDDAPAPEGSPKATVASPEGPGPHRADDGETQGEPRDLRRRPRAVYGVGHEPDARFSLANERTALAWVRTGLGLVAGGVALTSFATFAELPIILDAVAAVACLAGAILALYALRSWHQHEVALRQNKPLPAPAALPVLVGGVVLISLLLAGYAISSMLGEA
jgi:putative membrane protein